MPFSSQAIKSAAPNSVLWDDLVPGLHLRVRATSASYALFYRTKDGRQRRPKLGDARVMTRTQARERARSILLEVANGGDPAGDMLAARAAPTVADLIDRYLKDDRVKAKKSFFKDERNANVYLRPRFGNRKVASMEAADFDAMRKQMADAPIQFNRCLALASTMFGPRYAEKWKLRPAGSNPTAGVSRYPEKKRRRYMKPPEALAIARLLNDAEATSPGSVAFLRLLILTGARPDEIARARWEWVAPGVIHDPDAKTGERDIFLSPAAQAIVESLPRVYDTITGIRSPKKLWERIRKEAGCPDLRMYDLRHSFASVAISMGLTLAQIGELLGHVSTQTTQRYAHLMDEHKRDAVARISTAIEQRGRHEQVPAGVDRGRRGRTGGDVEQPGTLLHDGSVHSLVPVHGKLLPGEVATG